MGNSLPILSECDLLWWVLCPLALSSPFPQGLGELSSVTVLVSPCPELTWLHPPPSPVSSTTCPKRRQPCPESAGPLDLLKDSQICLEEEGRHTGVELPSDEDSGELGGLQSRGLEGPANAEQDWHRSPARGPVVRTWGLAHTLQGGRTEPSRLWQGVR